ncbi:hypothetical protein [Sulfitobacter sp. R18_1]|uniref:hypothetical protein n=1 Tax=Sulfitobacter sp. R18_1 TaxID=2821104 RepID=UPI001AD9D11D|nr:hypothetical protein [Sulfitobacter sp. R18_1]MBO9428677.1 hypothetical protein [Sulfitobacter sp. R18_1]
MKRKPVFKPRDSNVPAMRLRVSGAHGKTKKAIRRSDKVALKKMLPGTQMESNKTALFLSALAAKLIGRVAQW